MSLHPYFLSIFDALSKAIQKSVLGQPETEIDVPTFHIEDCLPFQGPTGTATSLDSMPLPMKTLLIGLFDVKINQANDYFSFQCNTQNKYMHVLDLFLKTVLQCFESLRDELKKESNKLAERFEQEFPKAQYTQLRSRFQELGLTFVDLQESNVYPWYISNRHVIDQTMYQETLNRLLSSSSPSHVTHSSEPSVKRSKKAILDSQKMRQRLEDLSKGPVQSFMTWDTPTEEPLEEAMPVSETSVVSVEPNAREGILGQLQSELSNFYWCLVDLDTKTNQAKRQHVQDICMLYSKTFQVLAIQCKRNLDGLQDTYICPTELQHIDKSLQQEIRLLYSTITINQDQLQSYLSHIRYEVHKTKTTNQKELERRIHSYTESLRLRMLESILEFTKIFQELSTI